MIYLTLKHILDRGGEIGSGWYNYLNRDNSVEKIARERALTCGSCEHRKQEGYLKYVRDDIKEAKGHLCIMCGCPLSMKVRSEKTKCPIQKW
jgi:hypothetical protein